MAKAQSRVGIAQYEATVVLVVISLSLGSVVYSGLKGEARLSAQPVFVSSKTDIGGNPPIARVIINSSTSTSVTSLNVDEASSKDGVLAFDGSSFLTSGSLCAAGATTFFSVLASQAGTLTVTTDGRAWVDGTFGRAVTVAPGWQEVMIVRGTSCSISLPGGLVVSSSWSPAPQVVSSIPAEGAVMGTSFTFYIPDDGGPHSMLMTSTGGFNTVAL